jgi:hypothetical protein
MQIAKDGRWTFRLKHRVPRFRTVVKRLLPAPVQRHHQVFLNMARRYISEPVRALGIQRDVILAILPHFGVLQQGPRAEQVARWCYSKHTRTRSTIRCELALDGDEKGQVRNMSLINSSGP